jgi:peroxiredoxin Q/BCP
MLNTSAPDFALESSIGHKIGLKDLLGSFVVLIFYPMNDTPICNHQLGDISLRAAEFIEWNARIFGVNTAPPDKHREYCSRRRLNFPILSDPGGVTSKRYKSWMGWLPMAKRTVVIINPEGTICFYKRGTPSTQEIKQVIENQTSLTSQSSSP